MTFGQQNTEAEAHAQLNVALEQGVYFFDTAKRPQGRAAPSPPPVGVKKTWGGPAFS